MIGFFLGLAAGSVVSFIFFCLFHSAGQADWEIEEETNKQMQTNKSEIPQQPK